MSIDDVDVSKSAHAKDSWPHALINIPFFPIYTSFPDFSRTSCGYGVSTDCSVSISAHAEDSYTLMLLFIVPPSLSVGLPCMDGL